MNVAQIARLVDGTVEGDLDLEIRRGNAVEMAQEDEIAFVQGDSIQWADNTSAGCVIVAEDTPVLQGRTVIRVSYPRNAFAKILQILHPFDQPAEGVHASAVVADSAVLAKGVSVAPGAVIEEHVQIGENSVVGARSVIGAGCRIGTDCQISASVILYAGVKLGDRVILHSGCVVGADGFGYVLENDHYEKFPQIGVVEIGNDVELGANVCVDRGALGVTTIGDGTKLDNMVHVGHNCRIGRHVLIAAQTGLSGGCLVDDYVVMGGQVGMGEQAHIGTRARIGGQSGVLPYRKIPPEQTVWGTPSRPHREYLRKQALVERLPRFFAALKKIEKKLEGDRDKDKKK